VRLAVLVSGRSGDKAFVINARLPERKAGFTELGFVIGYRYMGAVGLRIAVLGICFHFVIK